MPVFDAVVWGLVGAVVAVAVSLSNAIVSAGHRWPWRRRGGGDLGPRAAVWLLWLVVAGGVCAGMAAYMNGAPMAFVMGVQAPAQVRLLLSKVQVQEGPQLSVGAPVSATVSAGEGDGPR